MRGWAGMAQWEAVRREGLEKLRGETGQGVPPQREVQVEVHESPDGPGVLAEPCGLELDWWLETWQRQQKEGDFTG